MVCLSISHTARCLIPCGEKLQMSEHKKLVDQRKKGVPGSKEAEVFHLQKAMEERNEKNVRPKAGGMFVRPSAELVAVDPAVATRAAQEESTPMYEVRLCLVSAQCVRSL